MTRPARELNRALALAGQGVNSCEISRLTGIPRRTIVNWRHGRLPGFADGRLTPGIAACIRCSAYSEHPFPQLTDYSYAYLLGLYLGDGCLASHPRGVFRLRISLDRAYPAIRGECVAAMSIVMPASEVGVARHPSAQLDVPGSYSKHWPCLFPQHGSGLKHHRRIELEDWQRAIVDQHPWRLLRGLIHSDGCRHLNTIRHPKKTYRYPRYEFSNRSDDIRGLFCEYCDRVGVEWRRTNRWNISVARRESVALMDHFIGPKR